ncbi:MAG: hypothetical protein CME63_06305 [Halobacteriovoraceae bacterium]|nr:hypothetical protein [Halobacteriovoraceae bacterium]|tara:strand:- start:43100 stop:44332 length:1233 start_codon:yes stop_codon:yes gene_type:complete
MNNLIIFSILLSLYSLNVWPQENQPSDQSTKSIRDKEIEENKENDPFPTCNECSSYFKTQEEAAFNLTPSSAEKGKGNTRAVYILQKGRKVYERYNSVSSNQNAFRIWSMSKSIASLLIGRRIFENKMDLNDPLEKYYPQLKEKKFKGKITIENLLTMSSGLEWNETYENNPLKSHVIRMLYLKPSQDMGLYTLNRNQLYPPGAIFNYSSGETNLLMRVLKESFKESFKEEESPLKSYLSYPWNSLFTPLDITSATWETDRSQTFVGSSYLYMRTYDLAKIGQLILDKGLHKGERLLSEEYLKRSFQAHPASCNTKPSRYEPSYSYGYSWWLNAPCPERKEKIKAFANLPDDLILALGHHGQTMAIFPSLKAVAIRFGADKESVFNREAWLNAVYQGLLANWESNLGEVQ